MCETAAAKRVIVDLKRAPREGPFYFIDLGF